MMIDEQERFARVERALTILARTARRIYAYGGNVEVLDTAAAGRRWIEALMVDNDPDITEEYLLREVIRIHNEVKAHVPMG